MKIKLKEGDLKCKTQSIHTSNKRTAANTKLKTTDKKNKSNNRMKE